LPDCIVIPVANEVLSAEERLARFLRDSRLESALSQRQVAEAMVDQGFEVWHQTTVAKTEAGTRDPSFAEVVALGEVLCFDASELLKELVEMVKVPGGSELNRALAEVARITNHIHFLETQLADAKLSRVELNARVSELKRRQTAKGSKR
jgi:hypothetical protein